MCARVGVYSYPKEYLGCFLGRYLCGCLWGCFIGKERHSNAVDHIYHSRRCQLKGIVRRHIQYNAVEFLEWVSYTVQTGKQ